MHIVAREHFHSQERRYGVNPDRPINRMSITHFPPLYNINQQSANCSDPTLNNYLKRYSNEHKPFQHVDDPKPVPSTAFVESPRQLSFGQDRIYSHICCPITYTSQFSMALLMVTISYTDPFFTSLSKATYTVKKILYKIIFYR